ncbi:alginate O-acetyltransferase AlgX-related protein [Microbacterium sp.]|uniref:alginate O-acetyltransferase AlgX-related protein n=1 Tax=Microbacterium sp. TaxID=51671 RepID=UPI0028AB5C3F|nr:hypothetical protein [Microbacterium sp.]
MSAGPSLHSMHRAERQAPRSRAQRIAYFVPLILLLIAVLVMTLIGVGAKRAMQAEAARIQQSVLGQESQQSSLPQMCVSEGFSTGAVDIWTGPKTASSDAEYAMHTEVQGMRVQGRDGFDFWGDEQSHNFSQALGRAPWLDEQLAQWITYFSDLDARLQQDGRDLVIVVVPAKWELYREKLPEWTDDLQGKTHLDQFLERSGDLPIVDVREAMQVAKRNAPVYSAVNTHWSPYGAYAAWQQIVGCAADLYPESVWQRIQIPEASEVTIDVAPNEFVPYGNTSSAEDWAVPTLTGLDSVRSRITASDGTAVPGPTDGSVGLLDMPAKTESDSGTGRALIMRDSTGEALAPIWASTFQTTCQERHNLDYPGNRPDVVDQARTCDADTVLFAFTERYFAQSPPLPFTG